MQYTSSNAHKTEQMEQVINSIPSKGEILQEALRDATKLLNDMNQTGNAESIQRVIIEYTRVKNAKFMAVGTWRAGTLQPGI